MMGAWWMAGTSADQIAQAVAVAAAGAVETVAGAFEPVVIVFHGANVDQPFGGQLTALGEQTEFFHSFTTNAKHQYDVLHRLRAEERFDVVDLYDYLYLSDPSGQAAILAVKFALQLIEPPNPIYTHAVRRTKSYMGGA